jgi:thioredoxin reductase (NADPH)
VDTLDLSTDAAGFLLTGGALTDGIVPVPGWPLARQPLPLETNAPGVFVAGDVRSGSTKRCAAAIGEGAMSVALVHEYLAGVGT